MIERLFSGPARLLAVAVALVGLAAGSALLYGHLTQRYFDQGYDAGQAAVRLATQRAHDSLVQIEAKDAADAVRQLGLKLAELEARSQSLKQEIRRGQSALVLAPVAVGCGPGGGDGGRTAGAADLAQPLPGGPLVGPASTAELPEYGDMHITAAGVRVWDSALAGEQLSIGACGPDDPASAACAAGSGRTLRDAWENHVENAERCRVDRERHAALIEFLKRREQRAAQAVP